MYVHARQATRVSKAWTYPEFRTQSQKRPKSRNHSRNQSRNESRNESHENEKKNGYFLLDKTSTIFFLTSTAVPRNPSCSKLLQLQLVQLVPFISISIFPILPFPTCFSILLTVIIPSLVSVILTLLTSHPIQTIDTYSNILPIGFLFLSIYFLIMK